MKQRINLDNLIKETKIFFYRSPGPGGQRKNKKETAVRVHHTPTGIETIATEFRSQIDNKKLALHRLKKKLLELTKKRKKRITTMVPQGIKEEIFKQKKIRSEKKQLRKKIELTEDY
ncbi:MAG: peptide chain release factor-like protein [Candidatus Omnitrophica bacterium]|nr:peptide chain release factor-like protein [Candidatus Omnitrophota bacterium]HOX55074.1 peptide chain release factor-like protein [Candidatus Omnitrophota bacterium]